MPKRSLTPSEHQVQVAFINWCRLNEARYPALKLAFACPNGGLRNVITAKKLKAEGVRPGVPDWWLPVPSYHPRMVAPKNGLTIEFKRPGAKPSEAQWDYIHELEAWGWSCHICSDWERAAEIVKEYLGVA